MLVHQGLADNHIREIRHEFGMWFANDLTMVASPSPAPDADPNKSASGYVRGDSLNTVIYQAQSNGHVIEMSFNNGWHWNDLTNIAGGP